MTVPSRQRRLTGRHALVDGIPFTMPVGSVHSPALMAAFSIDAEAAKKLMPGNELHPFKLWNRGLLVITVIDYRETNIGKYIEFSIAIACTQGKNPAPRLLPGVFMKTFKTGQFVWDLPVSTEVSEKGGKGIWGMPKHQASLDYIVGDEWVSSQYDLDGEMLMRIDIEKPKKAWFPLSIAACNYCTFRGMLMKSYVYFKGKVGFSLFKKGSARLFIGDHPRMAPLKTLDIDPNPIFTGFLPEFTGVLDDYMESWFITEEQPITQQPEGMESVCNLGRSEVWPAPPKRKDIP